MKYQKIMARSLPVEVTNGTLEGDIAPGDITFYRLQSTADCKLRGYIAQGEVLPVATKSFGSTTGALDYVTGKAILKLLQDTCRQEGMTVIVITHTTALTPRADRVIHIKNGRVAAMERSGAPTPVEEIEW